MSAPETSDPFSAGIRAARLLEEACRSATQAANSLQLKVVGELALDIGGQLGALATLARETTAPDLPTEAALHCADLANLAACNVSELPTEEATLASEAARLAAGAVHDLRTVVESGGGYSPREHAGNLLRDVRSAAWRAEFAKRVVDESAGEESPG